MTGKYISAGTDSFLQQRTQATCSGILSQVKRGCCCPKKKRTLSRFLSRSHSAYILRSCCYSSQIIYFLSEKNCLLMLLGTSRFVLFLLLFQRKIVNHMHGNSFFHIIKDSYEEILLQNR